MTSRPEMLAIQGNILEGGGQILRNAIAYATIQRRPIRIDNIRGGRSTPGLRKQHLAGILAAAQLCNAQVFGAAVGSTELTYVPGEWSSAVIKGELRIEIGSAGACSLVIQTLVPILLHAPAPISVMVTGGTDVPFSPPMDYLSDVLFPRLQTMGAHASIRVVKRGYMPTGGGEVELSVVPLGVGERIHGIEWVDKQSSASDGLLQVCVLTGNMTEDVLAMILASAAQALPEFAMDARRVSVGDTLKSGAMGIMLTDKSVDDDQVISVGSSLASWTKKKGTEGIQQSIMRLVKDAVQEYERSKAAVVDEYQQDQLIIFMALAASPSRFVTGEISLHSRTAMHFAEVFTGATFEVEEVEGGRNVVRCVPASVKE